MKRFVFNSSSTEKIARNNDPLHKKKLWRKSFAIAGVMAALGVFFLLALGDSFTVFSWVLIGCSAFVFVDGLVTRGRK